MRNKAQSLATPAALAMASLLAGMASIKAGEIIDLDRVVTGSVSGALVVVDVPYVTANPTFGGPLWTDVADSGFITLSGDDGGSDDGLRGAMNGTSPWEPDGTPVAEAKCFFTYGNGPAPGVTWNFNLADSGIDLPDGAVINAIYATWLTRNVDGITYEYTEGAASGSIVRQQSGAAPTEDLVLKWFDSDATERTGNFEKIFTGPITVEGGDGFTLWGTDNIGNAAHIDAVIIDVSGVGPTTAPFAITEIEYAPDAQPNPTVTLTWRSRAGTTYSAFSSTDFGDWSNELADSLGALQDEKPDDGNHLTVTFELRDGLELEDDLFFRVEEE